MIRCLLFWLFLPYFAFLLNSSKKAIFLKYIKLILKRINIYIYLLQFIYFIKILKKKITTRKKKRDKIIFINMFFGK